MWENDIQSPSLSTGGEDACTPLYALSTQILSSQRLWKMWLHPLISA